MRIDICLTSDENYMEDILKIGLNFSAFIITAIIFLYTYFLLSLLLKLMKRILIIWLGGYLLESGEIGLVRKFLI